MLSMTAISSSRVERDAVAARLCDIKLSRNCLRVMMDQLPGWPCSASHDRRTRDQRAQQLQQCH